MHAKHLYDAVIIGAGHNGLVAANYLAKAHKKVLVIEQRHVVGGAALTEQLIPGFKFSRCSYVLSLFRKNIIKELDLVAKGLKINYRDIPSLTPTKQVGKYLLLHKDSNRTKAEISKFSKNDAAKWDEYEKYLSKFCQFWDNTLDDIPINFIESPSFREKADFLRRSFDPRLNYFDFGRFITSSAEEMLDNWFQSDILKATLATDGIIGENLPINHPSTGYILLHHVMGQLEEGRKGDWGYVEGGNGRLSEILAQSAKSAGAEIRLSSPVQEIIYDNNKKPVGVRLLDGSIIESKIILSNCTNRVTFFQLTKEPQRILERSVYNKLKNIEYNGAATKINLALKSLPKFKSFKDHELTGEQLLQGTIHVNSYSMQGLKQCFNQTKTARISSTPLMDLTIPSIFDKTMCPQGYHIMNCFMQYTPYKPNTGQAASRIPHSFIRQVFLQQMNEYLQEPLDIHHMDILTPHDLEDMLGLTEGNIFHGAIGLDNLYTNRLSGKIGGVWVCGSAAHPGGGVMGAVGRQVSQRILHEKVI